MKQPLMSVRDLETHFPVKKGILRKTIGHVRAVDGVSFDVFPGETLGIVGESGCGKSTMARTILRLIEPTKGSLRFDGVELTQLPPSKMKETRRQIQMVFQDPYLSLNPSYRVGNLVERPMAIHGLYSREERRQRAIQLLERCGLDAAAARRFPSQFSGGQRQRVGIARALALYPKLLILDEPVSALDVSIQAQILNLLRELQGEMKLTYIFISHDLGVVKHISDRVGVMYLGRLVELADAEVLFRDPKHPYSQALLSAIPVADPDAPRQRTVLTGEPPSPVNPPSGCPFHTRCKDAMDVCKRDVPRLQQVKLGHWAACHLYPAQTTQNAEEGLQ